MRRGRTFRRRRRRAAQPKKKDIVTRGTLSLDKEWTDLRIWCKKLGMPKSKLGLAYFPTTFRGMMATKNIEAGEDLIRVPERLLVTASKIRHMLLTRPSRSVTPNCPSRALSEHQALAYWIYSESCLSDRSTWSSYMRSLPRDFESVPLYVLSGERPSNKLSCVADVPLWVAKHLPHSVLQRVVEQQRNLFSDWTQTRAVIGNLVGPQLTDWRRYVWSWLVVGTRCIHLGSPTSLKSSQRSEGLLDSSILKPISCQDSIALAPVLDLLNHSHTAEVSTGFESTTRQFVITTHCRYSKGQEVFISYGPHDNHFMLAEYGFVSERNPFQILELDYEMDAWLLAVKSNECLSFAKAAPTADRIDNLVSILKRHGLWGDFTLSPRDSEPSYRVLAALYLLLPAVQYGEISHNSIDRWERWRRGENLTPTSSNNSSNVSDIQEPAAQQWIQRICGRIVQKSDIMLADVRKRHSMCPQDFLYHCLGIIWHETNQTARFWSTTW
ncbi:SET domain-containing protein [Coemansia reversa NRRL 1564]|uniref:SET domain-containing protein n=1 Tax=Coemansia reversa (strain ATCC 12441 / NRRL 1564) TaxID=763665 RepID=A0A2G5B4Q4_COERN|nr:SET domain-containing protein [Coemansia reversa NRRL 1564]|eukprot:PIA13985.1 SET domain-containing protein [Coemansia reversa NRRL 1564]